MVPEGEAQPTVDLGGGPIERQDFERRQKARPQPPPAVRVIAACDPVPQLSDGDRGDHELLGEHGPDAGAPTPVAPVAHGSERWCRGARSLVVQAHVQEADAETLDVPDLQALPVLRYPLPVILRPIRPGHGLEYDGAPFPPDLNRAALEAELLG